MQKEAIAKMKKGQADYNKALENVAEFLNKADVVGK
jgi:hypothetical protein